MIESLNRQDVREADYPPIEPGNLDWSKFDRSKWAYVCDCCRRHVSEKVEGMHDGYWWHAESMNPRLVTVGGVTYYGCSNECARILFDIHNRYSQLAASVKENK